MSERLLTKIDEERKMMEKTLRNTRTDYYC